MKFAVSYSTPFQGVDPGRLLAYAQHAETYGFEGFLVPEHVVLHQGAAIPADLPYADPLVTLGFVAAATSRILLGTAVLLLPFHHPVVLAKRLATLDVLANGRLRLLTVGLGSLPGEARALGVDYPSRGRRADEAIDVLRLLWAGDASGVSFHGEFFDFDDLVSYPKPVGGTLPIHVGGSSRAAARRAGRRGDGYFPGGGLTPDERALRVNLARQAARDPDAFEYTRWGSIDLTPPEVEDHAEQGVTRIVVGATSTDELSAFAERFGLAPG